MTFREIYTSHHRAPLETSPNEQSQAHNMIKNIHTNMLYIQYMELCLKYLTTLKGEIFAGRKFRVFAVEEYSMIRKIKSLREKFFSNVR